jgi:branched-chain amino acid transport system substrate-binding protein
MVKGRIGGFCAALLASTLISVNLAEAADDEVIVGAATATSGWMAPYDEGPVAGAQMAIDEINASGGLLGKKLALSHVDTKTDTAQSAKAGAELLDQGAKMLIVSCDFDMGGPAALIANQKKVIAFSTCGADIKLGNMAIGPYVFTMATDSTAMGALLADWAYHEKGWRKAYVLVDTIIEYTKSLCRGFSERWEVLAGAEGIVGNDTYKNDDPSVSAQVTRYKSTEETPEVMALCGVTPGFPSVIRQFRAAGIDVSVVSAVNMDGDAWHAAVPAKQLTDVYYISYSSARGDDPRPEIQTFIDEFTKRMGSPPTTGQAVTGHSVVTAWARAVERAGTFDSDAVLAELNKFSDEPLLAGLTTFTADLHTNTERPMLLFGFENGTVRPYGYYDPRKHGYVE